MIINLKGQEAEDYVDYRHAISIAKQDPDGLVVTAETYNNLLMKQSVQGISAVTATSVDPQQDSLLSQLQDIDDDRPQQEYDEREVSTTFPIGDDTTVTITRTSAPKIKWESNEESYLRSIADTHPTMPELLEQFETNRTEMAVRTKLNDLGYRVINRRLYYGN